MLTWRVAPGMYNGCVGAATREFPPVSLVRSGALSGGERVLTVSVVFVASLGAGDILRSFASVLRELPLKREVCCLAFVPREFGAGWSFQADHVTRAAVCPGRM